MMPEPLQIPAAVSGNTRSKNPDPLFRGGLQGSAVSAVIFQLHFSGISRAGSRSLEDQAQSISERPFAGPSI
jgi:hypothetical protein